MAASATSKIFLTVGIILAISAITAIYISEVASGQQSTPASSASPSQSSGSQSANSTTGQSISGNSTNTGTNAAGGTQSAGGSMNSITIPQGAQSAPKGQAYLPNNARVQANAKVTWQNKDSVAHTATARDGSFDTGNIAAGSSGSATIKGEGNIDYYCTIHPTMTGTLTVGAGGGSSNGNSGGGSSSNNSQTSGQAQSGGDQSQQQSSNQPSKSGPDFRTASTTFKVLPKASDNDLGIEQKNKDNWVAPNHDIFGTRSSQQTTISKDNIKELRPKWILNTPFPIETPPLLIGDRGYAQNNAMQVIAFNITTGLNLWTYDPGVADQQTQEVPRGTFSHGITYDNGIIFAPTGANGTVVAINATDGKLLWQTAAIGDPSKGFRLPSPPIVWKNYVVVGSALGDEPPFAPAATGTITAYNRTNGDRIWNITTVTGKWIEGDNAKKNGGGTVWSGGSLDPANGILYVPTGNAAPDFDASTRPPPNPYTNSILAIDIAKGRILWHTQTTPFNTHDWDTAWGTSLSTVNIDGRNTKVVIGQNKLGNAFALDAVNGHVLWNDTLGVQYQIGKDPQPEGSGTTWPGTQYGVEAYNANDGRTAYFAVSNMGFNYFKDKQGTSGHLSPMFDAIENGVGNGTIVAVDIATGKIKWSHPTDFPTWVSPVATNGIVFSGHITATGKPYKFNDFGAPTKTPLIPSGIIMALDADNGKTLWQYNVGAPIGIGGPSVGHGMLFVTTGSPAEIASNKGGYIVAFDLRNTDATSQAASKGSASTNNTFVESSTRQVNAPTSHQ